MSNLTNKPTTLDDFKILKVIGKGSFGSVYLVSRKEDQKIYALKTVFMEKLNKKEQENSVNEVRLLASISHPNVIGYKEAFWDEKNSSLNIIMEYADDGDLQTKIIKKKKEKKYFNENLIWLYSIQMIEGLKALHDKKIMHRDLKSANIFLTKNKHQCKLGDMNVSKVIKEKFLTTQTGTPYYASPEVWKDEPYSYKSDLWSIGCVIYEMCELRPPFNGKNLDELFENVCKGDIKRINNYYSDKLWEMILMLLQHDVNKRVDCKGFLNSEIIKNKIKEFKNNPNTCYEGNLLEKNRNSKISDDFLLETINFENLKDLKKQLPNFKNYENNNKVNVNFTINDSKTKNENNNVLITNSSIKSNNNQNLSVNNNKSNKSNTYGIKRLKKKICENIYIKANKINNFFNEKENTNNIKQKNTNKDIIKKLPKNISFNGINRSLYVNGIKLGKPKKKGIIEINTSDRNLSLKKNSKNKEYIRIEKKKIKEFEKIIEYNKIKDLLKISKKKENNNSNKTERIKKGIKKSCGNIFRNQTENNNKIINTKINNQFEDIEKNQKNISILANSNKSNLIKRINTEQKMSLEHRIYKFEYEKNLLKKIIKSPTSISIMDINQNKERSCSQGTHGKSIESINGRKISIKNKINNIYYNLFNNLNKNKNINNKKNKLLPCTPNDINKKYIDKSTKRNLTTIPYNNESNKYIKSMKNKKKQNRLLNEVFNTVNFNLLDNNIIYNSLTNKFNYYLNFGNYYSEINKTKKAYKTRKIICKSNRGKRSPMTYNINKKKNFIKIVNKRLSDNNNNIFINNSCIDNNQLKHNLLNYKNYSIIINKKKKYRNKSNENEKNKISKKLINKKIITSKINNSYNPLSQRQRSIISSLAGSLSNSNVDIIKKRNSFTYNINKNKKNRKIKNISIKKINIPPFCNIKNNNSNNFIRYKNYLKNNSNKNILCSEPLIISNREKSNHKIKHNKKILNFSANDNYINFNHNSFLHNVKPIYLNIKNNNLKVSKKNSNNINRNKRIYTAYSGNTTKDTKLINSQIFNNYYSINNIDTSNLPVKVINFYN